MAANWWSIEVLSGDGTATGWRAAYGEALVESAITHGAVRWEWHEFAWGVVFEVAFAADERWEAWRRLPGTQAALDAVPDPVNGLLVYRGRGGSSGAPSPRRPRLSPGAAAVELPEPDEDLILRPADPVAADG
ncbi:MAG TPA: hypothetical protein VFU43_26510 [Streptosporangiaceae bacterium]|nr:hypothetical protein [Streptosporangiaceae bacterium]